LTSEPNLPSAGTRAVPIICARRELDASDIFCHENVRSVEFTTWPPSNVDGKSTGEDRSLPLPHTRIALGGGPPPAARGGANRAVRGQAWTV